jgi:hypothetical protein
MFFPLLGVVFNQAAKLQCLALLENLLEKMLIHTINGVFSYGLSALANMSAWYCARKELNNTQKIDHI